MKKDHLISTLKTALVVYVAAFLFFCVVGICYGVTDLSFGVPACLALALPFALLGGVLAWHRQRIHQLELQVGWLMQRLNQLQGEEQE